MPTMNEVNVEGVRVQTYGAPSDRPPLLFVHGGTQGSWAWERMAPRLAAAGWYAACLNWFGHHGSADLPPEQALARSIPDVATEIGLVAEWLGRPPVLVAHSMGGLASLVYATTHELPALALITPVVPARFGGPALPMPVDPSVMYLLPSDTLHHLFWNAVDEDSSRRYSGLICPESPQAVREAIGWLVDVDTARIGAPTLVFGAEQDMLVPVDLVRGLAAGMGAEYIELPGEGHGVPLNPVFAEVADHIDGWLGKVLG
jgi:pimeloyl-ACP methyl ester carboxylesterase